MTRSTLRRRLAAVWAIVYGLGFPLWVVASTTPYASLDVPRPILAALVAVWGGTAVYFIGKKRIGAWLELVRGDAS